MVMTGFFFPDENLSVIKLGVSCFGRILFHRFFFTMLMWLTQKDTEIVVLGSFCSFIKYGYHNIFGQQT